tara:strand:+ start:1587 stop:1832 length:246 start_codon:yes stop_codon:yes gene_type:complete
MAENKLKTEELEKVKSAQQQYQNILMEIGLLSLRGFNVLKMANEKATEIEDIKKELEKQYGPVNIDLQTGEYTKAEETKSE